MGTESDPLKSAGEYFAAHRAEWVAAGLEGKWAAVHESTLIGMFPSLVDAFDAGAKAHAAGTFLVKQVTPTEDVQIIHRVAWHFLGV